MEITMECRPLVVKSNLIHSYEANPLVNAMCVGLIDHKHIQKGQAKGIGNTVMYVGATTGRDGIHGATLSSKELTEEVDDERPAIQVGDPYVEQR